MNKRAKRNTTNPDHIQWVQAEHYFYVSSEAERALFALERLETPRLFHGMFVLEAEYKRWKAFQKNEPTDAANS